MPVSGTNLSRTRTPVTDSERKQHTATLQCRDALAQKATARSTPVLIRHNRTISLRATTMNQAKCEHSHRTYRFKHGLPRMHCVGHKWHALCPYGLSSWGLCDDRVCVPADTIRSKGHLRHELRLPSAGDANMS